MAQTPTSEESLKIHLDYHQHFLLVEVAVQVCERESLDTQTNSGGRDKAAQMWLRIFFFPFQWTFKNPCVVSVYLQYCLTTPERGWFRCWFHRPHAAPPHRGLPWPTPARRSHLRCPCGSPRPSVAFAGTWQHTASPLPSQCTFLPPQTFPWETKRGESERVISEETE